MKPGPQRPPSTKGGAVRGQFPGLPGHSAPYPVPSQGQSSRGAQRRDRGQTPSSSVKPQFPIFSDHGYPRNRPSTTLPTTISGKGILKDKDRQLSNTRLINEKKIFQKLHPHISSFKRAGFNCKRRQRHRATETSVGCWWQCKMVRPLWKTNRTS